VEFDFLNDLLKLYFLNNQLLYLYLLILKILFFPKKAKYIFYFAFGSIFFHTFVRMKKQGFLEGLLRADFCSKRYFIY